MDKTSASIKLRAIGDGTMDDARSAMLGLTVIILACGTMLASFHVW